MFKVGDRVIGIGSDYKGHRFKVIEARGPSLDVLKVQPLDEEGIDYFINKCPIKLNDIFISDEFFEFDKQYYREERLKKLLD